MITVAGLSKHYGGRAVVDDVSFTVEPGIVTGFLGPNGAGKTTTMRMITGLIRPSAGEALVEGSPYARLPNPAATMGTLLDASAVHPGRTGHAHLAILAETIGLPAGRADEVLELVDLGPAGRRRVGGYSLGMRQRLGIAASLLADPPVLMYDEPANGLDPEGIRWLRELLRGHAARGGTVLLSSHLLGEVKHTVDRLVVIGHGRIVADSTIGELLTGDGVVVDALDPAALAADLRRSGLTVADAESPLRVRGATTEQVGRVAVAGGHVLTTLQPADRELEDLFFQLTAA